MNESDKEYSSLVFRCGCSNGARHVWNVISESEETFTCNRGCYKGMFFIGTEVMKLWKLLYD